MAGELYDEFDPERLIGGNESIVVRLIHGARDNNVFPYFSAQLHEQLSRAGYDVEYTLLDTRHGALIRPGESAGQFVVDRVVARLGAGDEPDIEEPRAELAFDGATCSYSGPSTLAPAEELMIRLRNDADAATYFVFYNIEGVELEVALNYPGTYLPKPSYVGTGAGRMVPAGAERVITWAFVDQPYQWVLACVDPLEPHGSAYYRVGENPQIYHAAGLAPTNLD